MIQFNNHIIRLVTILIGLSACDNESIKFSEVPSTISIDQAYFVEIDLTDRRNDTFKVDIYVDGFKS